MYAAPCLLGARPLERGGSARQCGLPSPARAQALPRPEGWRMGTLGARPTTLSWPHHPRPVIRVRLPVTASASFSIPACLMPQTHLKVDSSVNDFGDGRPWWFHAIRGKLGTRKR